MLKAILHRRVAFVALACLLAGCHGPSIDLRCYRHHDQWPVDSSSAIQVQRLPSGWDSRRLVREASAVGDAVRGWLQPDGDGHKGLLCVFSPDEPEGKALLRSWREPAGSPAGRVLQYETARLIAVVGSFDDPRFWTILRHEVAHDATLAVLTGVEKPPFWLAEGIATLFEVGVETDGMPQGNPERSAMISYLLKRDGYLKLDSVLKRSEPVVQNGAAYARAWCVVRHLYRHHREVFKALATTPDTIAPFPYSRFLQATGDGSPAERFEAEVMRGL